jgi:hypothetical protein
MIELKDMELTIMWMAQSIKENGSKINSMDTEPRAGQIMLNIAEITHMGRRKDTANSSGLMEHPMTENSKIITSKELEYTYGQMAENIMGNGQITRCMEKENLIGLMGKNIKVENYISPLQRLIFRR